MLASVTYRYFVTNTLRHKSDCHHAVSATAALIIIPLPVSPSPASLMPGKQTTLGSFISGDKKKAKATPKQRKPVVVNVADTDDDGDASGDASSDADGNPGAEKDFDQDDDEDQFDDEMDASEEVDVDTKGKKDKYVAPEDSSLPPLSSLSDIFADLVDRLPELKELAIHLTGRKLRVATMCSGTESPLLALRMITRAMERKWGVTFEVEHVFSCEIVPFKQAYIERNFRPRLLFRDVTELHNDYA